MKVSQKELWQVKQLRNSTWNGQIQQYEMQFISDTMNVVNQNRIISHKNINYKTYCSIISGATFWNFHNSLFSNKIWIQQWKVVFPFGDWNNPGDRNV